MDFRDTPAEAEFRDEVRTWLAEHLVGEFRAIGGRGGPSDEDNYEVRIEWERILGPRPLGRHVLARGVRRPRRSTTRQQVIFNEEYAKAGAPTRISFFGEGLFSPTLLAYGREDQKHRFLPKIQSVEELWCQGYSEPNAGSDLSNVTTRAVLDGDEWVINGQKVWTTLAHRAQWCFAVVRTDPDSTGHKGLSYLLVPMDQPGIEVRPLKQMTGTAGVQRGVLRRRPHRQGARARRGRRRLEGRDGHARLRARHRVPVPAARASRTSSPSSSSVAQANGAAADATIRQELADSYVGVQIMKYNGMRMLTDLVKKGVLGPSSSIGKLYWSNWHRTLGERAMHVLGADGQLVAGEPGGDYELDELHRIFMVSRAETIYAGASEIQRNIIGERVLGLPREPRRPASPESGEWQGTAPAT